MTWLQEWTESLSSWNLKYDPFPEVMVLGNTVLIGINYSDCSHTCQQDFPSVAEAEAAGEQLHNAMKCRADAYWGVR